jgi:TonB family protein
MTAEATVDRVLEARLRPPVGRLRAAALAGACLLHLALAGSVVLGARLAREREPVVFTPVRLMPLAALGVERPRPKPPEPRPEPPRPAAPAPEPVEPKPEKPAAKPEPEKPRPQPAPAAPPEAAPAERRGTAAGSALGTSAFGAVVGALDNPAFTYDYYLERMLALIEAQWTRPPSEQPLEAVLHFRIARDGRVTDLEIAQPSGVNAFDLAALRAVANAAPLPPLPGSYASDSLGVNLIVR